MNNPFIENEINNPTKYKYEIVYMEDGNGYITSLNFLNITQAKLLARQFKESKSRTHVKIIEFKTIERIIEV